VERSETRSRRPPWSRSARRPPSSAALADELKQAREAGIADRVESLGKASAEQAATLTTLKQKHDTEQAAATAKARDEQVSELLKWSQSVREPSKAREIGGYRATPTFDPDTKGAFLYGVHEANARDTDRQATGKAILAALRGEQTSTQGLNRGGQGRPRLRDGRSSAGCQGVHLRGELGQVDPRRHRRRRRLGHPQRGRRQFIAPAAVDNIYRGLMTVIPGVTAFAVDLPFRSAARTRAAIAAFGATKENVALAYNGYTATMYTLARIYDIGNQFLRQSRGAAEADVLSELAAAFAQGESYYIREGSGSSQPFGYTSALTNGPGAFRSTFSSPSDSTVAGSIAAAISVAAGALAGRGVKASAAVLSATSYWNMLRQGSDSAGFWFATQERNPASVAPEPSSARSASRSTPMPTRTSRRPRP
jgi:hypothetical protein